MIKENLEMILNNLPQGVTLVVAGKGRNVSQMQEAIAYGAQIIGENYVKEAQEKFKVIGNRAKWHLIGHLQKNKAKYAVKLFDMIETLDSVELAAVIDKECKKINKIMPVLIEVNSAQEPQKSGVLPQDVEKFITDISKFDSLKLAGLMTMGPLVENPESIRTFFKTTKEIFDRIKARQGDRSKWLYLSMGMSDTYKIAIEEGANMVRIGTAIFGEKTQMHTDGEDTHR